MATATLTTKGQITLPLVVRQKLRLKPGDRLDFVEGAGGRFILQPKRIPFEDLRGILRRPGQKRVTVAAMDRGIERAVRARWERSSGRRGR